MKKLIEVKNKTWGETSEGKYTKKKKIQHRSQGAESFSVGAFINNNGDIPW